MSDGLVDATTLRRAYDAVATAEHAISLPELERTIGSELRSFGFDVVVGLLLSRRDGQREVAPLFGDTRNPAIVHYVEQGHAAYCPIVGSANSAPTLWRDVKQRSLTPGERQVLNELGEFSYNDGHIVTVSRPDGPSLAVSLASSHVTVEDPGARAAVHLLSVHYGLIGLKLARGGKPPTTKLSARQIECIKWARDGKSSAEIGDVLGISARTVDQHLAEACARLSVKTRVQAVIEAFLLGLVQF
ncbi:LuxR family transcriptional regulator [Caulobacter sp. 17J80-11]|uniref:helix-turn-helix transcriptional regulator n=1 Tax=Caulobacter sp. 17J80-11 TaxID=2763502 RepID=UPI001653DC43|nr:LuxR family transcriptional regulator [Caulobacter sp. 17J80-11]MBC6981373.1 autoinducer binding domain-containing protein [Caulobacter sp. 17J80-11]